MGMKKRLSAKLLEQIKLTFKRRLEINTNWKHYFICCNILFSEAILMDIDARHIIESFHSIY